MLGVEDLCKATKMKPASVRNALRRHKIKRAAGTRSYEWETRADMDEVAQKIMTRTKKGEKTAAVKKSAAKKTVKKPVKKAA